MTMIIGTIVAMAVIVGLVVTLYRIGVSREGMIMAALIAGLLLGGCIGTCFGEFEQRDQYDKPRDNRSNYFDSSDYQPSYYAATPYNSTPTSTSTQSSGWNWSAISNTISGFFSGMGRWLWPSSEY
jgi:hypothetical protein